MRDFFPIIDLNGNAYDMGMTHGRTLAKEIKANLELYFMMVRGLTGLEPQQCLTHAGRFLDVMQTDAPFLLEEMEGIARGAGMSLKEILFLNARSELMSMGRVPNAMRGECTAIGLTGVRTVSGKPILAQNWDWHERVHQTSAIFRIDPKQRPKAIFLAEAGQVGKLGIWGPEDYLAQHAGAETPYDFAVMVRNVRHQSTDIFGEAKARGWQTLATSPFGRGWLLDELVELEMEQASEEEETVRGRIADALLRFSWDDPNVDHVIVGIRKKEWIGRNLESIRKGPLSEGEREWLMESFERTEARRACE